MDVTRKRVRRPLLTDQAVPASWPFEPWTAWCLVSMLSGLVTWLVSFHAERPPRFFLTYSVLGLGFAAVPVALLVDHLLFSRWLERVPGFMTTSPPETLDAWTAESRRFAAGSPGMFAAGVVVAAATLVAQFRANYFDLHGGGVAAWAIVVTTGSSFLAGAALAAMFRGSAAVWRLGRLQGAVLVLRDHRFGVLATGRMLAIGYLVATVVWLLYSTTAVFNLPELDIRQFLASPPVLMLSLPTLPVIVLSFIACQLPLHMRMSEAKSARLAAIEAPIDAVLAADPVTIDAERRSLLDFLEHRRTVVLDLPEWPFTLQSLIGIGGSTVVALAPVIATIVTKRYGSG